MMQNIHAGKNDPITSTEGALEQELLVITAKQRSNIFPRASIANLELRVSGCELTPIARGNFRSFQPANSPEQNLFSLYPRACCRFDQYVFFVLTGLLRHLTRLSG